MQDSRPKILRLSAADIGQFRDLMAVFGTAFDEPQTYGHNQPSDDYLADWLGSKTVIAVAAIISDAVVGGLVAYELKKFEQQRSEIYIYDLAVAADYRRMGIASALIAGLKSIAKHQGAYVIYVQADLEDAPAIALYSKLGTRDDVLHFDIGVD